MEKVIKNERGLELMTSRFYVTKQVQKNSFVIYYLTKFDDVM